MIDSVAYDDTADALVILDQTKLPGKAEFISLQTPEAVFSAIRQLKVRGAPAIGIAAAYGLFLGVRASCSGSVEDSAAFMKELMRIKHYLVSSRPTAVNLSWALERMEKCAGSELRNTGGDPGRFDAVLAALKREAGAIKKEEAAVSRKIGEHALGLLQDGWGILTHCNAGALAMPPYGTALAPLYAGAERGIRFKVYADETRPLLQGARLTAWELQQSGIDVTLICDGMASAVMKLGLVQAVLVGCDRVAANGDAANKIGTSGAAILAKHYRIPFYVCSPLSTIDMRCADGSAIVIEERPAEEITDFWYRSPMAPAGTKVYNPAFDVTEADLITAIITEKGAVRPPYKRTLAGLFAS